MTAKATSYALGIDVGGTSVRMGWVTPQGDITHRQSIETQALSSVTNLSAWIKANTRAFAEHHVRSRAEDLPIGLAVPGLLDERRETVRRCLNVPWLEGHDLAHLLIDELNAPVRLFTDADAATWGEYTAAQCTPQDFAHLRIGTGVALGVIQNGALIDLTTGRTGHLETLVVDRSEQARLCRCGRSGCLDTVLSGCRTAGESGIDEAARWIVRALENVATHWSPEHIVLGGGFIDAHPKILARTIETWDTCIGHHSRRPVTIRSPALGDDAGIMGAARLAQQ